MREVPTLKLPELNRGAIASRVSTDVHILHRKAVAITKKFREIQVAELAPEVISIINWFLQVLEAGLVETAGYAPVCGTATKTFHSVQGLAVRVPIWRILVDRCILEECFASKMRQAP